MSGTDFTVSVGIAAYNADGNIGALLSAVSCQRQEHLTILEIIVHSDHSTDRTVAVARACTDPRLEIVDHPDRRGLAASVVSMIETFKGDALVLLNDDIRIADDRFIEKIVFPVLREEAGLAGANLQPLPARSFVERASVSVFRVWERIRESMADRNTVFTCDGAAMCLSARLARSIAFPDDLGRLGNVDAFLFLSCVNAGFRYAHAADAVAYFRSPATLRDYVARNIRNDSQPRILEKHFGTLVAGVFKKPAVLYWKSVAAEVMKNPLGAAFIFVVGIYIRLKAKRAAETPSPLWEVVRSSKELD